MFEIVEILKKIQKNRCKIVHETVLKKLITTQES